MCDIQPTQNDFVWFTHGINSDGGSWPRIFEESTNVNLSVHFGRFAEKFVIIKCVTVKLNLNFHSRKVIIFSLIFLAQR